MAESKHSYIPKEKVCAKIAQEHKRTRVSLPIPKKPFPFRDDLKCYISSIYDQGQLSSCTANALAQAYRIHNAKETGDRTFMPSRLYIYAKERALEESKLTDDGAVVDDGLKEMCKEGVCAEELWPYDENQVNNMPPACCDQDAAKHKIGEPFDLPNSSPQELLDAIRHCISELKSPVLIAIDLYESFEGPDVAASGLVQMPRYANLRDHNDANDRYVGGHEMLVIGYDDTKQATIVCNSWGPDWGDHGYCYIPYEYLTNPDLAYSFRCFMKIQSNPSKSQVKTQSNPSKSEVKTQPIDFTDFAQVLDIIEAPIQKPNPLQHLDGMGSSEEDYDFDDGASSDEDAIFPDESDDD